MIRDRLCQVIAARRVVASCRAAKMLFAVVTCCCLATVADAAAHSGSGERSGHSVTAVSPPGESGLHGLLKDAPQRRTGPAWVEHDASRDGVYNRPFIASAGRVGQQIAVGGYLESAAHYFVDTGVSEGFGFEFRRFNLFTFASFGGILSVFSELEFEHGTEEIALETAQLDIAIDPRLILRAGIIVPPIGRFNANHDGPLYEFVDRPLVSTRIIPATLSEVGAGVLGKQTIGPVRLTWDLYAVNGLQDGVIANSEARTFLPAGKSPTAFEHDNNGQPAVIGRFAVLVDAAEVGLSWYGGVYNTFRLEGETVAPKRRVDIAAIDLDAQWNRLTVQGEFAWAWIDVPNDLGELYGERQYGFYVDGVYELMTFRGLADLPSSLLAAIRVERIDYNVGRFRTGTAVGDRRYDEQTALSLGLGFRPVPDTSLRLNVRNIWTRDLIGNPASRATGIQVGVATWF